MHVIPVQVSERTDDVLADGGTTDGPVSPHLLHPRRALQTETRPVGQRLRGAPTAVRRRRDAGDVQAATPAGCRCTNSASTCTDPEAPCLGRLRAWRRLASSSGPLRQDRRSVQTRITRSARRASFRRGQPSGRTARVVVGLTANVAGPGRVIATVIYDAVARRHELRHWRHATRCGFRSTIAARQRSSLLWAAVNVVAALNRQMTLRRPPGPATVAVRPTTTREYRPLGCRA